MLDAAAAGLRELRWPSATHPYVSRHADTALLGNVWELPAGLDPAPPGLDDDARASVGAALETLDACARSRRRAPSAGGRAAAHRPRAP